MAQHPQHNRQDPGLCFTVQRSMRTSLVFTACRVESAGRVVVLSVPNSQRARRSKYASKRLQRGRERVATAGSGASGRFPIGTRREQ